MDQAVLAIPAMTREHAARYRCSYQNGSLWSPPSDQLELIATGNRRGGGGAWPDVWPQGYVVLSSGPEEGVDGDEDDSKSKNPRGQGLG